MAITPVWYIDNQIDLQVNPKAAVARISDHLTVRMISALLVSSHCPANVVGADLLCVNWTLRGPATSPGARIGHAMAYDSSRAVTVLFGGNSGGAETWEWDGQNWTQRMPITNPSSRYEHAMAYDSTRNMTVLFGGNSGSGYLGDTWEWDGANWTQRSPTTSPTARAFHAIAFDRSRDVIVLFGGRDSPGNNYLNDTWEWDGTNWAQRTSATTPFARAYHAVAYDSFRGVTVLNGGFNAGTRFGDTWEWNGLNWTLCNPTTSPPARNDHAIAYDDARGVSVLFGGYGNTGYLGDTWKWNGNNWTQVSLPSSPSARFKHAIAYDEARGISVLFGGFDDLVPYSRDTWEFGVRAPDGDINVSGGADGRDILPFLVALLSASTAASDLCHSDFDADGFIDIDDLPGFTQKLLGF